ncbi:15433_t:CDS:2 [Funneliformis caledonium]|uniref:15433_t:CDS:1 n=1 Tax=Funneliformis caledonium TaxID=1117310 RepID=A0A9N9NUJ6_9GLOM|nr:15433_t:CDS:2 [Funneliformis caledonium]
MNPVRAHRPGPTPALGLRALVRESNSIEAETKYKSDSLIRLSCASYSQGRLLRCNSKLNIAQKQNCK